MRTHNATVLAFTLAAGFLLGVFTTIAVYGAAVEERLAREKAEAEQAIQEALRDRDEAQAKIVDQLERQRILQEEMEQGGPVTPPAAVAPRPVAPPATDPVAPPATPPQKPQ